MCKPQDSISNTIFFPLGNYGKEFHLTRHNIAMDAFVAMPNGRFEFREYNSFLLACGDRRRLILSRRHMNNSGEVLLEAVRAFPEERVVVLYDNVDLPLGSIRVSFSDGRKVTHNGVRSLCRMVDTANDRFVFVMLGIGPQKGDLAEFVLSKFSCQEQKRFVEPVWQKIREFFDLMETDKEKAFEHISNIGVFKQEENVITLPFKSFRRDFYGY